MPEDIIDDDGYTTSNNESEEEEEECDSSNLAAIEIKSIQNKALTEFRYRVEQAIIHDYLLTKKNKRNSPRTCNPAPREKAEAIMLWGVPLLPSLDHPGTNVVLLKFLKAKSYKVHEAFVLLRKTLRWRAEFKILEENSLGVEHGNVWFQDGRDKEGRPLCYHVLGDKSHDYLRWRVQCLEKGIQNLNFRPGGTDSIVQIIDLRNLPGLAAKEVRLIYKKMISLLHDHYPGIVHKTLIINVPSWFMTLHALNLRIITKKSKKKFVFAKTSKVTKALLKYATPENIPVQYGGLKRDNDTEFSIDDKVLEANVRGNSTARIEIPTQEAEVTVTWDVVVVGYEVTYKEEFIPEDDCSYEVLLQKEKKMETSSRNTFAIRESGKIVISIVNGSYAKKKVFYRYKSRPSVPPYMFIKQQ